MGKKLLKKNNNRNHMHKSDTAANAQKNRFSVLEELSTFLFDVSLALTEKDQENTDDLISSLPDDILLRIISFLPFHSALNTRVLSGQWNDMWIRNVTLIKHGYQADIAPAITEFLNHCKDLDSLKKFQRLQFHFSKYQILLVSVGLNWKLHLDFSKVERNVLGEFWWLPQLPNRCSFIHELCPSLKYVKSLKLTSMNYYHTSNIVTCIINLELLETLVVQRCNEVRCLCIKDVPKLQNIIVLDCPQLQEVYIEADHELGFLRVRGKLIPCIRFQGNFSLKAAMLDIREGPGYYVKCDYFDSFLQQIRFVKILTLCRWTFETIGKNWLHSAQFRHLKDLWWIDSSVEVQNIDTLFSFLKICPSLERLFITINPTRHGTRSTIDKFPSNGRSMYTKRGHLKVVKLENLTDEEGLIFLAENLLEAFDVENLVIVASDGNYLRTLVRIPEKRATQKGKCYKFVEDFDDNNELCSKHAHMGF